MDSAAEVGSIVGWGVLEDDGVMAASPWASMASNACGLLVRIPCQVVGVGMRWYVHHC